VLVEDPGGLRTPPTVRDTGENYLTVTQDLTGRVYWTRRMFTVAGVGWSTEDSREYSFAKPSSPPLAPFTGFEAERTVSYRNHLIGIGQGWDLSNGIVVPYVAGGAEFRWVTRSQKSTFVDYVAPVSTISTTTNRSGSQISVLATAGLRFLVGEHFVVCVDGLGI
jgi:hypothetical protein